MYTVGSDRHFIRADLLPNCSSDTEAVELAKQLLDGHDVEVWERDRMLARLSHEKNKPKI